MTALHPTREQIRLVDVLAALGHPIRLQMVRNLSSGEEKVCGEVLPAVPKSTQTGHWRVLRESGLVRERQAGRNSFKTLRRDDVDARFPGLLDLVFKED
ncbi:ArsR/SmtB family transcription factor [Nonomuraea sp. NPDC050663]|uniref:ArsR/SmtB family transcription factor n=1 Tax=Nonomuraea sp. NPDC050663 TaxID=3364370 RepID=UPI0017B7C90E|nr:helix-turn-helix transcriptional regulator [Thermoactinospora sp.]